MPVRQTRVGVLALTAAALALASVASAPAVGVDREPAEPRASLAGAPPTPLLDPDGNTVVVDHELHDDGATIALTSPTFARATAIEAAAAPQAKKKLKTLVIPVFWSGAGKDTSGAKIKKRIKASMTKADTYFRTVSAGRIGHRTTALGWQKISRPAQACGISSQMSHIASKATAKARSAGKNPARFDRVIFYVTQKACGEGFYGVAGLGSMPGKYVWLEGTLAPNIVIHELGHNLGLDHARYRACSKKGKRLILGTDAQCGDVEYGDATDVMGNNPDAGWLSAPKLAWLGWASAKNLAKNTATKKKTYTLRPVAAQSPKLKIVRVKGAQGRYYWVEYRKRTGLDKSISPGLEGVQIRLGRPALYGGDSAVLDMLPAPYNDWFDLGTVALGAGASWTSPEGIRFSVGATGKTAKVTVQRKAAKPKKPRAPRPKVTAQDRALTVSWKYPKDRGTPVQSYELRVRSSDGAERSETLALYDGQLGPSQLTGLDPSLTYSVSVRARNLKGASPWSTAIQAVPLDLAPTLVVHSPAKDATVGGPFDVVVTPSLPAGTSAVIESVDAYLLDEFGSPWAFSSIGAWDAPIVPGTKVTLTLQAPMLESTTPFTLRVHVSDSLGRTSSVDVPVTVKPT